MRFRLIGLTLLLALTVPSRGFTANPPPTPSSASDAEVLSKKTREELTEKISGERLAEAPEIESEETPAPENAEVSFYARQINLEGNSVISVEDIEPLLKNFEGREVTFSELADLGKKLEHFFRAKGYMASVYVPPQRIEDGRVTLQAVFYKMGELLIEGQKYSRKWKIRSYWHIPSGAYLNYEAIQQSLMAMNENPDRVVRSYLQAGKKQGEMDVHLKVDDHFPLHAGYSLDNQGTKLTGNQTNGFTVRYNNLLGMDDIFLVGTSFGRHFGALFIHHLVPLNSYGTRFIWGYSHSEVEPKHEFEPFGIHGMSENYNLSIRQKIIRTQRMFLETYLGFDFKEQRTKQLSITSTWNRLRVLSTGGIMQLADKWGFWLLQQNFYFGIPLVGDQFPLTSRGAETSFFKYGFEVERVHKLFWGTRGLVHFEGQLSRNKLVPSEQLFLGGIDTVRGYADNDYGADQGFFTRVEYQTPLFIVPKSWKLPYFTENLRDSVQLISFLDHGYGFLRRSDENEHKERNLLGVGAGFRIHFRKYMSGTFEWGVPLGDPGLVESSPSQFHFKFTADV